MVIKDFLSAYHSGRIDYSNERLVRLDLFTLAFLLKHFRLKSLEESFDYDCINFEVGTPLSGMFFKDCIFKNATLHSSDFMRSDFSNSDLTYVDGRLARFAGCDFSGVDFTGADLSYSDFTGACFENAKFKNTKLDFCTFKYADFTGATLENITCQGADFSESKLINCKVENSTFFKVNFTFCDMSGLCAKQTKFKRSDFLRTKSKNSTFFDCFISRTNATHLLGCNIHFTNTSFNYVDFTDCQLTSCIFKKSNIDNSILLDSKIKNCTFIKARISETDIDNTVLEGSVFENIKIRGLNIMRVDLTPFLNANISHENTSSLDYLSVSKTILAGIDHPLNINPFPELKRFMNSCGMPAIVTMYLIDSLRSLNTNQLVDLMRSTFISYGGPDEKFAKRINSDLRSNGVTTFFFPINAVFGEKLYNTMRRVENYDRIIMICSKDSLDRNGVQYELEKTLEREARDGGESYLIPISLDDYLFTSWNPSRKELKNEIVNRVVADFSDPNKYEFQFDRLLQALRKKNLSDL